MSLNPDTRKMEWVSIANLQCYDFVGELVRFSNKSLDCAVTSEHRMVYLNKSDGRIKYCPASEYTKGKGHFIEVRNMMHRKRNGLKLRAGRFVLTIIVPSWGITYLMVACSAEQG